MNKAVWKFPFPVTDEFTLKLPHESEVLSVQIQDGMPQLWCLCSTDEHLPKENHYFRLVGTGHPINKANSTVLKFVGTFQLPDLHLVFHLFEEIP